MRETTQHTQTVSSDSQMSMWMKKIFNKKKKEILLTPNIFKWLLILHLRNILNFDNQIGMKK